jgi:LPS sulfotransferase NodH
MINFIILTMQRSGSTVFWKTINLHPDIKARGEMFLKGLPQEETFEKYLETSFKLKAVALLRKKLAVYSYLDWYFSEGQPYDAKGFKLMYDQMHEGIRKWVDSNVVRVVHLVRDNLIKVHVSQVAAKRRKQYHVAAAGRICKDKSFDIDIDHMIRNLERMDRNRTRYREYLSHLDSIEVSYEEFTSDTGNCFNKVFEYLGVSDMVVSSDMFSNRKLNPDTLEEIVSNYGDVEKRLRRTHFARYL